MIDDDTEDNLEHVSEGLLRLGNQTFEIIIDENYPDKPFLVQGMQIKTLEEQHRLARGQERIVMSIGGLVIGAPIRTFKKEGATFEAMISSSNRPPTLVRLHSRDNKVFAEIVVKRH